MRSSSSVWSVVVAALLAGACGGGDGPTQPNDPNDPNNPNNPGNPSGPTVKADPSFAGDIVPLFTSNGCTASGCHGPPVQGNLTLSSSPYTNLVNRTATTGEILVIPGNANDSYLVKKLEGRQSAGDRMPQGGQLNATDLTNIKNWINQGAKNN